ncbi:MAG: Lrp/AsnC family transcriptional regulator [Methylococcales bacterium]|nr:Lrp/AsnC family transcriptional regulator [Methylococcales bacterium]
MEIDEIDRKIINATQLGLPLVPQPYQVLAESLNMDVDILMQKITTMQTHGVIRRIGVIPNHYRLGYRYNGMTVWNVIDEKIDLFGKQVGELEFVSHCYHRPRRLPEWPYNLFAMVHSKTKAGVTVQIDAIADLLGEFNLGCDVLYSRRILKKTGLRIG